MFKIRFILFLSIIFFFNTVSSQSIRKNYNEMTQSEKDALVAAFVTLGPTLVNDLAVFHNNNFDDIHFNLDFLSHNPIRPELDVFFAWHRYQMFTMEQAMQDINDKITIPFWDWTVDNSASSTLWDTDFMGYFGASGAGSSWNLGRNFSNKHFNIGLPSNAQVTALQNISYNSGGTLNDRRGDFYYYSNTFESAYNPAVYPQYQPFGFVHPGAHVWVGGIMEEGNSPADPIFYLHHTMIDKLWQDWSVANNITTSSDLYQKTSLPNWPAINPDDIVDSKVLGVFYAENNLAQLHDYSVTNDHRSEEVFYYQYTIEAKDNFIIPNGKVAKIESVNNVILKPGFHAESGASFIAKIDTDNDITTTSKISSNKSSKSVVQNDNPFSNFRIFSNQMYRMRSKEVKLIMYSDDKDKLGFEFKNECTNCEIEILDSNNNIILNSSLNSGKKLDISLQSLAPGKHSLNIAIDNNHIMTKEILKL